MKNCFIAMTKLSFLILMCFSKTILAQNFDPPVYNPFSIGQLGFTGNAAPTFGDLDNDGDFDMMVGCPNAYFYYFKNVGTSSAPSFANPVYNPFSIGQLGFTGNANPALVDLDNDGDLDMMVGCPNAYFNWSFPIFLIKIKKELKIVRWLGFFVDRCIV